MSTRCVRQKVHVTKLAALLAAVAVLTPSMAAAHRDWAGDVHPVITVVNGRFVIRFESNVEDKVYETVLTAGGEIVESRRQVRDRRPRHGLEIVARQGRHVYELLSTPTAARGGEKADSVTAVRHTDPSGAVSTFDLDWGSEPPEYVSDAVASDEALLVLGSDVARQRMRLHRFDLRGKLIATATIGNPEFVYCFPAASPIAAYQDRYVIAWLAGAEDLVRPRALNLSWWEPATNRTRTVTLDPQVSGNTTVSIGVIGKDILVAYHAPTERKAVIRTIHLHGFPGEP